MKRFAFAVCLLLPMALFAAKKPEALTLDALGACA